MAGAPTDDIISQVLLALKTLHDPKAERTARREADIWLNDFQKMVSFPFSSGSLSHYPFPFNNSLISCYLLTGFNSNFIYFDI